MAPVLGALVAVGFMAGFFYLGAWGFILVAPFVLFLGGIGLRMLWNEVSR